MNTRAKKMALIAIRAAERLVPAWAVGDACASYKLDAVTKIVSIERAAHGIGLIANLENGDSMHLSKVRSVSAVMEQHMRYCRVQNDSCATCSELNVAIEQDRETRQVRR